MDLEKIKNLLEDFKAETTQQAIRLTAQRSDRTTATSSKFGGLPYLPKNFAYPTCAKGNPLKLLAQLNFVELPNLPPLADFPSEGILQFFVLHDNSFGAEIGRHPPTYPTKNWENRSRVIYHKEVHENEKMTDFPNVKYIPSENEKPHFPFEGEFLVTGELAKLLFFENSEQHDFSKKFEKFCKKHGIFSHFEIYFWKRKDWDIWHEKPKTTKEYKAVHKKYHEILGLVHSVFDFGEYHLIGGYPRFQEYELQECENLRKYDTLLFQMSSEYDKKLGGYVINWGESGTCNFYINRADLRNLKFDDVFYCWDSL